MSRSHAQIERDGVVVAHTMFNHTVDVLFYKLAADDGDALEAVDALYHSDRHDDLFPRCTCGRAPVDVVVISDHWPNRWRATACLTCMCIVDPDVDDVAR